VQVHIGHLQRGDGLVIIPITGDTANGAGGRILRPSAPTQLEACNTDLRRFQEQAEKQFAAWIKSLGKHQYRTDTLGALDAAEQEFALLPNGMDRKLVVVSDFLEDDGTYNFASAGPLTAQCKEVVLAFWTAYFGEAGEPAEIQLDGTRILADSE
jgi:hypothetical protein